MPLTGNMDVLYCLGKPLCVLQISISFAVFKETRKIYIFKLYLTYLEDRLPEKEVFGTSSQQTRRCRTLIE